MFIQEVTQHMKNHNKEQCAIRPKLVAVDVHLIEIGYQ